MWLSFYSWHTSSSLQICLNCLTSRNNVDTNLRRLWNIGKCGCKSVSSTSNFLPGKLWTALGTRGSPGCRNVLPVILNYTFIPNCIKTTVIDLIYLSDYFLVLEVLNGLLLVNMNLIILFIAAYFPLSVRVRSKPWLMESVHWWYFVNHLN